MGIMNRNWLLPSLAAIAIFVAGLSMAYCFGDRKVQALQHYADSVAQVARNRDSVATAVSDQLADTVAALNKRKTRVVMVARADSATVAKLDTAIAQAETLGEKVTLLEEQNTVLKRENLNLWQALAISDSALTFATARGDTLQVALHDQTAQIIVLNTRIQQLTPRTPKWLRISLRAVEIGAAFYAGTQAAK